MIKRIFTAVVLLALVIATLLTTPLLTTPLLATPLLAASSGDVALATPLFTMPSGDVALASPLFELPGQVVLTESLLAASSGDVALAADAGYKSHYASISNEGANKYKAIRITPEIYNNASVDLSNLRITANDEDIPYFIWGGSQTDFEVNTDNYSMTLINSYTKDDEFYFDYQLTQIPDNDIIATSINFSTANTGFAKDVALYGSYDNRNWEFIKNDTLYSVDDKSKLEISFDGERKFTHYRLRLANNLERISFNAVTLSCYKTLRTGSYFIETMTPEFSVEEENKITKISIRGLKNLRLAEIMIETDSVFKRWVSTPLGVGQELYNLTFSDASYTNTAITFERQLSYEDELLLEIRNNDDKPININGITTRYYADELVFEGKPNENYELRFGGDIPKNAPVYDIARYKDEILRGDIDHLVFKEIVILDNLEEAKNSDSIAYKTIFNVVIVVVAVVLGCLIIFKLRKKT